LGGAHYELYGQSAAFKAVWEKVKDGLKASNRTPVAFAIVFKTPTLMQIQALYTNAAGTGLTAWYDFNITVAANGDVTFARIDNPATQTDTQYGNGRNSLVLAGFSHLIDYLNNNTFRGDWIPAAAGPANYLKFGGFYVKNDPDNYLYGKF
jgi:hypothetical protein